jgi:nucleoside-diphosphate-sugar epimerase
MKISILGCGWLGFPLAKSLVEKGFSVNGSTTSENKLSILSTAGIHPYLISVTENEIVGDFNAFLENSEILLIDIPPKLRGNLEENFVSKIKNLIPFIQKSAVKKVIFVSSTSVYRDESLDCAREDKTYSFQNTKILVTENTQPQPETESGKQLLEAEGLLFSNSNFQTTVVRFGGLIGNDRHPIYFLAGRKNIENPDAPINFIHQKDCIGIIEEILNQVQNDKIRRNEIFNAVTPFHPTREDYYTQKAMELKLPIPEFETSKPSVGKLILSEKVEKFLGYKFKEILLLVIMTL